MNRNRNVSCNEMPSWYITHPDEPIPKTTTHESMELGYGTEKYKAEKKLIAARNVTKQPLSFLTYPLKPLPPGGIPHYNYCCALKSTYQADYTPQSPIVCNLEEVTAKLTEEPDPLINRKPKNDFDTDRRYKSKFLDDHFVYLTPARKKVNLFRQLRNTSFEFGYDE